jgi:hypothetical protein
MLISIPNLVIIAGTGTNSGKTTIACRLIEQQRKLDPVAIKISPNFHESTPGLELLAEGNGYSVYREKNSALTKDTSRMLRAGARMVFFAKVTDNTLFEAFKKIMENVSGFPPIICESPALRYYVDPGMFIIMSSDVVKKHKDISSLEKLPHVKLTLDKVSSSDELPVSFCKGKWMLKE